MILIVDDRPENIFSLKSLLELHKFTVDTALSGDEALKKILKNDYVLIILDVQMPGMDGFEVAEAVSGYSKTKDIPIIFLTALSTEKKFIAKGYTSGGTDYITKPYDADLLLLKVKTFYRIHEQTIQLNETQDELRKEIDFRKKAEADLLALNQLLEQRVEDRTVDLRKSNDLLEKKNAELQQFAYISSHDLKEPLRKIQVFSNLIKEKANEGMDKETISFLDRIILSTKRMSNLINDVLNYSMLDKKYSFEYTNVNEIIEGVISDLYVGIKEKNAVIDVHPFPVMDVVPIQMQQLFNNLISNALKFSKPGTAPKISIAATIVDELSFDANPNSKGAYCKIIVTDEGIGFDETYLDKIFTIFQRLHGNSEFEGTGIGLAIVKKIVDTHHGIVTAMSKLQEGSSFIIILPLQQKPLHINE
jgi:signal transduction histidine kinase